MACSGNRRRKAPRRKRSGTTAGRVTYATVDYATAPDAARILKEMIETSSWCDGDKTYALMQLHQLTAATEKHDGQD